MQRSLFALLLCLIVGGRAIAQDTLTDPRFAQAAVLDSLGKHDKAMRLWAELAKDTASRVSALCLIAACEFGHLGKKDEAFAHVRQAIEAAPHSFLPYHTRGNMYNDLGMMDRAIDDCSTALANANDKNERLTGHLNLGACYQRIRRFADALEQCDAALREDTANLDIMLNRSAVLDDLGRSEESITILHHLLEVKPNELTYMNNLGFLLNGKGRFAEAADWFSKGLELRPNDPYLLNNRGYSRLKAGDTEKALEDVKRSIKALPGNPYAYRNLGLVEQARGRTKEACDAFEKALNMGFTAQFGDEVKKLYDANCH